MVIVILLKSGVDFAEEVGRRKCNFVFHILSHIPVVYDVSRVYFVSVAIRM